MTGLLTGMRLKPLVLTLTATLLALIGIGFADYVKRKPTTELWLWETKFRGISSALILRDNRLAENFRRYKECSGYNECRERVIAQRDAEVQRAWREHFPLLVVDTNWAATDVAIAERQLFREKLALLGSATLRDACVPKIVYQTPVYGFRTLLWTGTVKHTFTGEFECASISAALPPVYPGGKLFILGSSCATIPPC